MEEFKIEHFVKENEDTSFPHYETIGSEMCKEMCVRLSHSFGLQTSTFGAQLTFEIAALQLTYDGVNAEDEDFNLKAFVNSIGIKAQKDVFVNWYQFDDIDKIAFDDLSTHFSDIWYPASDDIDVFDSSFSWLLSVSHDGNLQLVETKFQ